jgi:hypothetical protein
MMAPPDERDLHRWTGEGGPDEPEELARVSQVDDDASVEATTRGPWFARRGDEPHPAPAPPRAQQPFPHPGAVPGVAAEIDTDRAQAGPVPSGRPLGDVTTPDPDHGEPTTPPPGEAH